MASRQIFGLNLFALVLVLFLRIEFNSSEELSRNEKTVILGKDIADPSHRSFSLIDRIRKSDPGNEWQIADNPNDVPWIHGSAVNPYIGNEKMREKRFVFLLPLLRGIATVRKAAAVSATAERAAAVSATAERAAAVSATAERAAAAARVATTAERAAAAARVATTAERAAAAVRAATTAEKAAAATGIGAVAITNQQKYNRNSGISMSEWRETENEPRRGQSTRSHMGTRLVPKSKGIIAFRILDEEKPNTPVQGGGETSIISMQAKKPKSTTENKPRRGQSTPDHVGINPVPKPEDITAFPGLIPSRPKTPVKGGGGLRSRWKDRKGKIYEWDSKKGELEVYDKTGQTHKGGFDPYDYPPRKVTESDSRRKVEP